MSRARFAFAAHPDAIADLRKLPERIRDLALLELQHLVHGSDDCLPLKGPLAGFHKVYVDPSVSYRMAIQFRPAPPTSNHQREIYLVAAGSRKGYEVYRSAHQRTGVHRSAENGPTTEARVQAARSRSPHASHRPTAASATTASAQPPATAPRRVSPAVTVNRASLPSPRTDLVDASSPMPRSSSPRPSLPGPTVASSPASVARMLFKQSSVAL
ncbi:hypothetical protein GCM10017688_15450 [Streptomyces ramulosus]